MTGVEIIMLVGSVTSAVALAVWQLWKVKRVSEATRAATHQLSERVDQVFFAISLTEAVRMCREAQRYLRGSQWEMARMRMEDAKEVLVDLEKRFPFESAGQRDRFNRAAGRFYTSLDDVISFFQKKEIDKQSIVQSIEPLVNELLGLQSQTRKV